MSLLLLLLLLLLSTQYIYSIIYISPITKSLLRIKSKYYGFIKESYYIDSNNNKFMIYDDKYIDFISNNIDDNNEKLTINKLISEKLFQTLPISFIYERGYRQNFQQIGFPGIDKEFKEINEFFTSTNNTNIILDLSCGTGFMTRKFIESNNYQYIYAGDLSKSMLLEARYRINNEKLNKNNKFELIRLNVNKLPFQSNSINGIHAGAALHCWTDLKTSLNEIYRVLNNDGVFYGSTFFKDALGYVNNNNNNNGFYLFQDENELKELFQNAGFAMNNIQVRREGRACAIIKAVKKSN